MGEDCGRGLTVLNGMDVNTSTIVALVCIVSRLRRGVEGGDGLTVELVRGCGRKGLPYVSIKRLLWVDDGDEARSRLVGH